ncbi:electron transfer flavoprotein FixB [Campylobacter pinnipediorum subsp. pinnipediorum]|uniref:FAD-binding protein n=1 Tax=Campylobacter pinnipediorum TaxID=1965231 RepID=UPI00084D5426|nr:FAD-binding protein [Campylobacter pinnipediorum]AQW80741.1 electron transfer flavoprotein FixB [Campylobacter pinnipediorum subsp. pinnipediorum]
MSKVSNIWVLGDTLGKIEEIMGGAKNLGEKVTCFVFGSKKDEAKKMFSFGADEVFCSEEDDIFENFSSTVIANIENQSGVILMPNTKRCKVMAGILGAKLNAGVSTEVNDIKIVENSVESMKIMYGGLAIATEKINSKIAIVLVNSGTFEQANGNFSNDGEVKELQFVKSSTSIKCINKLPKTASSVDLGKAKKIIAVGRGVAKEEDLKMIKELCTAIGAELGCSRPIAEGEKWMEHERYIGISSVMAKPDVYISIGISGQVQHMVGVKDADKIIVINKDKNAPIFDYADYGIVGDLYKVVPALINSLK